MKKHYDFSTAKRGAVVPAGPGKTRITIRLDNDVLEWFRSKVDAMGGGSYQSMINAVLRDHIRFGGEGLEGYLRGIVREELKNGREQRPEISIPPGRL